MYTYIYIHTHGSICPPPLPAGGTAFCYIYTLRSRASDLHAQHVLFSFPTQAQLPYFPAWGAPFAIAIHRDLESCPGFDIVIHTDQSGLFPRYRDIERPISTL